LCPCFSALLPAQLALLSAQVKPVSKSTSGGCQTLNVETYGGGLWYTWFDRDLGLAGRVLVREAAGSSSSNGSDGKLQHRLVKIDKPVLRIPMLAIHLQRNLCVTGSSWGGFEGLRLWSRDTGQLHSMHWATCTSTCTTPHALRHMHYATCTTPHALRHMHMHCATLFPPALVVARSCVADAVPPCALTAAAAAAAAAQAAAYGSV
jgi:hypothetical protein